MTDFVSTRARFYLPDGVTYLDGNSLGPLPLAARQRVAKTLTDEWGERLIRAWNDAGWMVLPEKIGDRIGRLIGAPSGSVTAGDTLSIKIYQALAAALALRPQRRVVLSDNGNFPTDLYMAEGLLQTLGDGYRLQRVEPEAIADALDDEVAVLLLTEVDYRSGRLHDMHGLTAKAHAVGAVTVWDLAHSAGALPVDVSAAGADFAAGCTYKYLNGGPGAPAFLYIAPEHAGHALPVLPGWLGHEAPFAFDLDYRAGPGVTRMRVGTPPVIALSVLDAALDVWDDVDINDVRAASIVLSEQFISDAEARCPGLQLASPRDPDQRGSQVSLRCPAEVADGYAVMQALIARGVIGDFRAPDIIRFGFTPLYLSSADVRRAVDVLAEVLDARTWDQPEYRQRAAVT